MKVNNEQKSNIKADNHSLFKNEEKIIKNKYRFFIGMFNNQTPDFHNILNELYNADDKSILELRIMSPGGLVVECQQIVNLLENKFKENSIAYIESHASSAGAFTFIRANKRVIYWNSRIMFHNYSGGYVGKYKDMKDRFEFDEKHILNFLGYAKRFFTKKEWKELINGKDFWFDAKEMLKRGIATHIILNGKEYDRKKGLKKLKKFLKKNKEISLDDYLKSIEEKEN